ncbi:MFS transporter [Plantactinospora sp. KBS50]|uniref:MFS transporter n=1 Tax=Plantactinospora sp. KBS50 TaxID=2024580 RepID=UPI0012FD5227|nr:MFS transporter [Plantactinospora sp. KBS50]
MVTESSILRRHADFRRFWAGHTASVLGSQVSAVALPLVAALTLGAGASGVAAVATASYLPNVVLTLLVGRWLEARRRRRIMVAADLLRAAAMVAIPLCHLSGLLNLPLLVGLALLIGAATVVFDIGGFAYVVSLVDRPDLTAANRATQGSTTAAQVAGPGLAGGLVQLVGPVGALVVDAVSYLLSALGVAGARRAELAPPAPAAGAGILAGLRQLAGNPVLRALTVHAATYNGAAQVFVVNLIVYAVTVRNLAPGLYGLALSAGGAGAFLGTMLAPRLSVRLGYGRAFAAALCLSCGMPLAIAALPGPGVALAAGIAAVQLLAGAGLGAANVLSVTLRQVVAPHGMLTRTNAGYRLCTFGTLPLGGALGGLLGHAMGSRAAVAVGAAGMALSALPMLARRIRSVIRPEDAVLAPVDGAPVPTASAPC